MPLPPNFNIAIIGGGLAGLGLALALHSHSIPCTVYETVPAADRVDMGSMQIGPNALKILDRYGIYHDLIEVGNSIEVMDVMNDQSKVLSRIHMGSRSEWGFPGLRIYRRSLVKALYKFLNAEGVEVQFGKKFLRVVSESQEEGVSFEFADGTTAQASLLIAADGVHSRIRQALFPDAKLIYTGQLGVGGSVGVESISNVDGDKDPFGMYLGRQGTFILLKQNPDGSDLMAYRQGVVPDKSREEWAAMSNDKDQLRSFMKKGMEDWPKPLQNAMNNVREDSMWMWPIYQLSEIPRWRSEAGRVVLIGDAAHAMPPAAAQGGNLAFEDGNALALLLANIPANTSIDETLQFWEQIRKERIRSILDLTAKMMKARLPAAERAKLSAGEAFDFDSLDPESPKGWDWLWNDVGRQEVKIRGWLEVRKGV